MRSHYLLRRGIEKDGGKQSKLCRKFILKILHSIEIRNIGAGREYQVRTHDIASVAVIGDFICRGQNYSKVSTCPTKTPEEIRVFGGRSCDDSAFGCHQPDRKEGVN